MLNLNQNKQKLQRQIVQLLNKYRRGIIIASTGSGKTKAAIDHLTSIWHDEIRILWVTPTEVLRDIDTPAEFDKWDAGHVKDSTDFICYASLPKIVNQIYDVAILDEAHTITDLKYVFFKNNRVTNIICLTATKPSDSEKKKILYKNLKLPILIDIKPIDGVKLGIIPNFEIVRVNIPLRETNDIPIKYTDNKGYKKKFYTSEYKNYKYITDKILEHYDKKGEHNKFLLIRRKQILSSHLGKVKVAKKLLSKLMEDPTKKTLVFAGSKEQADRISNQVYYTGSSNEFIEGFRAGVYNHLVAVGKLDMGVNLPANSGIMVQMGSNDIKFIQRLGRILRRDETELLRFYVLISKNTVEEMWFRNVIDKIKCNVVHTNVTWSK